MKISSFSVSAVLFLFVAHTNVILAEIKANCVGYPIGDIDRDYIVDFEDLAILAGQWLRAPGEPSADIEPVGGDAIVDRFDLKTLCESWLRQCDELPPDPANVATEFEAAGITPLVEATEFLYTGSDPIQTGLSPGTIERKRAAVLRGRVQNRSGEPLSGVCITILNHQEYGETYSREDGIFDLAVNGGATLTLRYNKKGYFPVERQVVVPWQDYALAPDVIMCTRDSKITGIDLTDAVPIQTARGNPVIDTDGTRQSTILFPESTTAEVVLPDGETMTITRLNIRATEYTTGQEGPNRMPAELPPTSAYTYCVELSVDEADELEATDVRFNQPVYYYVENFLNFPTGTPVPSAYYDRGKGLWIPSENGRVIEILNVNDGLAEIDTDGDGMSDDGVDLGLIDAEREELAKLYGIGQSLWRVPILHFSPWDFNWPAQFPSDARPPFPPVPYGMEETRPDNPCFSSGSIIECESQVLGERIRITGTALSLDYTSDRVPGREAAKTLVIPVSGPNLPDSVKYIELQITVAGRRFTERIDSPEPNMEHTFVWDGNDAYGRTVERGSQPVTIMIGYAYDAEYLEPTTANPGFGLPSGISTGVATREDIIIWLAQKTIISLWDARDQGLGGWTLSNNHTYDPLAQILYLGDGRRRSVQSVGKIITTVAGNGDYWYMSPIEDGYPATESAVQGPMDVLVKPDGTFFLTDTWYYGPYQNNRVRYVDANGIITTVAGLWYTEPNSNNMADGIPATEASIAAKSLALGPDGLLYIASQYRVRRIEPDGTIETVAGRYPWSYSELEDGVPATEADMYPWGIAFGPDGSLYIFDELNVVIRRVDPNGIISTVAGNGEYCWEPWGICGDGGPATDAPLAGSEYNYLTITADGSIYFTEWAAVRKVSPDGIISTVLKNEGGRTNDEGIPIDQALANEPRGIACSPDGSIYVIMYGDRFGTWDECFFVRRIDPKGIVTTIAGTYPPSYGGDGGPPLQAQFAGVDSLDLGPDGSIYITDTGNNRVRKISNGLPGMELGAYSIASDNGDVVYDFDGAGRHLTTRNSLTGSLLYAFLYDPNGRLEMVLDANDNVLTIERDTNGIPTAIIAPFGQQTTLAVDSNGYLADITNSAGEQFGLLYKEGGLLKQMTDPRGGVRTYDYDNQGHLISNRDPDGNLHTLNREEFSGGHTVTRTSTMGRTTTYLTEELSDGQLRRLNTFPDGTHNQMLTGEDQSITVETANGITAQYVKGPDPRFGMQVPVIKKLTISVPDGPNNVTTADRTTEINDPNDPLGVIYILNNRSINGRVFSSSYFGNNRTWTHTTAESRHVTRKIDNIGRLVNTQAGNLNSVDYSYDSYGRKLSSSIGSGPDQRVTNLTYNTNGYVEILTDPLGNTTSYFYDAAGRVVRQVLSDESEALLSYSANGDINSITPPNRPAHLFTYTGSGFISSYQPPDVIFGDDATYYSYNQDNQLQKITRPDGQIIDFVYDSAGTLTEVNLPDGSNVVSTYDTATGQLQTITSASNEHLFFSYKGSLLTDMNWSGPVTGSLQISYNNDFLIASESVNEVNLVSFSYDNDGLLVTAGDITITHHEQNGLITATQIGNIADQLTYNNFGELESYCASYSASPMYSLVYIRDKYGRITQKTETIESTTKVYNYSYDAAGRLVEVKEDGNLISTYIYGDNGNRTSYNTISAAYDNQDRLLTNGDTSYTYTNNGELLTATTGGQTTTYHYDVIGNLISVELSDGTLLQYVVDGLNRRVGRKVNGVLSQQFLYRDNFNPVVELDTAGNVVNRFVYGSRRNVPDYMIRDGVAYRIICDHLGSPRLIVNAQTGAVAQRMDFDEFGKVLADTNPGFQPFGFAGGLYDSDTGLTRFWTRDYASQVGRWTSKDPIRFMGNQYNLYVYIGNDPINSIDPTGCDGIVSTSVIHGIVPLPNLSQQNQLLVFLQVEAMLSQDISHNQGSIGSILPQNISNYQGPTMGSGFGSILPQLNFNQGAITGSIIGPTHLQPISIFQGFDSEYAPSFDEFSEQINKIEEDLTKINCGLDSGSLEIVSNIH